MRPSFKRIGATFWLCARRWLAAALTSLLLMSGASQALAGPVATAGDTDLPAGEARPERYEILPIPTEFPGWTAEYFNAPWPFGARPIYLRNEPAIAHYWNGAPAGSIGLFDRRYSARYTRTFYLERPKVLRFGTATDGRISLWLDGRLLINSLKERPVTIHGFAAGSFPEPEWARRSVEALVEAGSHTVTVAYGNEGDAGVGVAVLPAGVTQAVLRIDDPHAFRNEQPVLLDTPPRIFQNRTFLPVRFLAESFGLKVAWDGERRQVTITDRRNVIVLTIDDPHVVVNDRVYLLDAAPRIVENRTLIPVRFLAEQIGATVDWDSESRTVLVTR